MLILMLMENLGLIHNQLILGFEAAYGLVFCPVEEQPHEVVVVGFRNEIATGAVEPYEPLLVEQCGEDFFVTLILGDIRHF